MLPVGVTGREVEFTLSGHTRRVLLISKHSKVRLSCFFNPALEAIIMLMVGLNRCQWMGMVYPSA